MATAVIPVKEYKPEVPSDWCPGCGDFGVLSSLFQVLSQLSIQPHNVLVVSGIGCSSNLTGFIKVNGVHSLHGRALPFATGAKLANHDMTVIATGGDGDGYGIGLNHFIQAMRRNINVTYIVMNNEVYGLTTGQTSPTSETGMKTKSTPEGNLEGMLNPMALALAAGCGFVARGFSGQQKQLLQLYKEGIEHKGFSLIDVFSPCVTFNKIQTYPWFRERVYKLEDESHDPTDLRAANERALEWGSRIPIGLLYRNPDPRRPIDELDKSLESGALVHQSTEVSPEQRAKAIAEFM